MYFCTFAGIDRLYRFLICLCFIQMVCYFCSSLSLFHVDKEKARRHFKFKMAFFFYLNITGLNNVHFSTNVVFPTDVVTGQIDYWTQFYNKLLQQAVVTVLKQFHLKNFLFYKSYFNSFTLLTYSVLIQLFQGSKGIRQWLINWVFVPNDDTLKNPFSILLLLDEKFGHST